MMVIVCGDIALDSEVGEEGADFIFAHFIWMVFVVKKDVAIARYKVKRRVNT